MFIIAHRRDSCLSAKRSVITSFLFLKLLLRIKGDKVRAVWASPPPLSHPYVASKSPLRSKGLAADVGTEGREFRDKVFVAAVDMLNARHGGLPIGDKPR